MLAFSAGAKRSV